VVSHPLRWARPPPLFVFSKLCPFFWGGVFYSWCRRWDVVPWVSLFFWREAPSPTLFFFFPSEKNSSPSFFFPSARAILRLRCPCVHSLSFPLSFFIDPPKQSGSVQFSLIRSPEHFEVLGSCSVFLSSPSFLILIFPRSPFGAPKLT